MSEIRLILIDNDTSCSGLIPSAFISSILWAASKEVQIEQFWRKLSVANQGAKNYFENSKDEFPVLEGYDDGLLVINWDHKCIESFQSYQAIKRYGEVIPHNGSFSDCTADPVQFTIASEWGISDHHFEETERVYNG